MAGHILIGADFGKLSNYSAAAIMEHDCASDIMEALHYEQWPLQTPYREVTRKLARFVNKASPPPPRDAVEAIVQNHPVTQAAGDRLHIDLLVDATGVGEPVLEILSETEFDATVWPVVLTGADKPARFDSASGRWRVPKNEVLEALLVWIQAQPQRLYLPPDLPSAEKLKAELGSLQAEITQAGRQRYTHQSEEDSASHGDMLIGLALTCWGARQCSMGPGTIGWG